MEQNKAFKYALANTKSASKDKLLDEFKQMYKDYRFKWTHQPRNAIEKNPDNKKLFELGIIPLCLDLEIAAICDLACPFCYREYIATPDKVINDALAEDLILQASEIGIPSIKLNWRGELLLYPKIHKIIDLAKKMEFLKP